MRISFFFQLLLALLLTTGVTAQGESTTSKKSTYVPNQLIAHYNDAAKADVSAIKSSYGKKGVDVTVERLSAHDLLLTFPEGFSSLTGNAKSDCEDPDAADCDICDVIGNPGDDEENENQTGADALWPNYYVYANSDEAFAGNSFQLYEHPAGTDYDPLQACDSPIEIPELALGQQSVDVAILDSGIETGKHQSFFRYTSGSVQETIVEWHQVGNESGNFYDSDPFGHGTAVAFLVAHRFVNAGKQDQIRLHSYRVLDENGRGTFAQVLAAVTQALADDVDVINMSFGFDGLDCDGSPQELLSNLIRGDNGKDILLFTSAGNDGNPLATAPQWPAADTLAQRLFTVGATACDLTDYTPWVYSNYGADYIDLMAPGTNIFVPFTQTPKTEKFIYADGTSFAAPIAAGVAANYLTKVNREQAYCLLASITEKTDDITLSTLNYSINGPINALPDALNCLPANSGVILGFPNYYVFGSDEKVLTTQNAILASPNPFTASLTIFLPNSSAGSVTSLYLYSGNGRLIRSFKTGKARITLNTNELTRGLYYLRAENATGQQTVKLIKQ